MLSLILSFTAGLIAMHGLHAVRRDWRRAGSDGDLCPICRGEGEIDPEGDSYRAYRCSVCGGRGPV